MNADNNNPRPFDKTPFFPNWLYDNLPQFFKDLCKPFTSKREKDVFLLGILCTISSIIKNVRGSYARQTVYPNLFVMVLAPPASGKSVFKYAKVTVLQLHNKWVKEYKEKLKEYNLRLKNGEDKMKLRRPKRKLLIIPGNSSSAAILNNLNANEGSGLIFETEIDTLTNVTKNDWGDFSDLLRNSFHSEPVSINRKKDDEYYIINKPRLAIGLTGTPNQAKYLIPSAENGLFSRFLFYVFNSDPVWKGVGPKEGESNLDEYFGAFAYQNLELLYILSELHLEVMLNKQQWEAVDSFFDKELSNSNVFAGEEASAIVMRLGVIFYKIAMILTVLRQIQDGIKEEKVYCSDIDFGNALWIVKICIKHSFRMYDFLPSENHFKSHRKAQLYEMLPNDFERKTGLIIATSIQFPERTYDEFLKDCVRNSLLDNYAHGRYKKITSTAKSANLQTPEII